mmetsp:Transcript_22274/g.52490  ORF Transcript_22274/g.52490 Transcript_22274/m.52490 type:complete len:250 (-) Transcript_22274:1155-1904(-)
MPREIYAEAAALPKDNALLVLVHAVCTQVWVGNALQRHEQHLFKALLQRPLENISIAADRHQQLRRLLVWTLVHPPSLPNNVRVLLVIVGRHGRPASKHRGIRWSPQVPNHDGAIVSASRYHVRMNGREMQSCHPMPSPDHSLGVGWILQRPKEHQATRIDRNWSCVTVGDGQQVFVIAVPLCTSHCHTLGQLRCIEAEQILQSWLVSILFLRQRILRNLISCFLTTLWLFEASPNRGRFSSHWRIFCY